MTRTFLIDANLPVVLARALVDQGHAARHVLDFAAASAPDRGIWNLARELNYVIVSRDKDFAEFARNSDRGPPVIWLRTGNARRLAIVRRFLEVLPSILAALDAGERLIEVR